MLHKNYFIAICKNRRADKNIIKILNSGEFQFNRTPEGAPSVGENIIFYISGDTKLYFKCRTVVTKGIHKPHRRSLGNNKGPHAIDFDKKTKAIKEILLADFWVMEPHLLKRDNGKRGGRGLIFKNRAFISIDKHDYNLLTGDR